MEIFPFGESRQRTVANSQRLTTYPLPANYCLLKHKTPMKRDKRTASLIHRTTAKVRFCEVDVMNIAWHGSYVRYLEDGREDFGTHFGISYMDIYKAGYKTPIVEMNLAYKKSVSIGDTITIETRYINCEAAKIIFDYIIYNDQGEKVATASTTQVFLDEANMLVLNNPPFYINWKKRWNLQ